MVYLKRTLKIFSLLIPVIVLTLIVQDVFFCNEDSMRNTGFYQEEKNSLDVVLIGSSEVMSDFYPGLAYRDYGITSYDWALNSASISLWKSKLEELKKYQNPKLIVVEVSGAFYTETSRVFSDSGIRYYVENMPLSFNKVRTIAEIPLEDEAISYYLPIVKYHSQIFDISSVKKSLECFSYISSSNQILKGITTKTALDKDFTLVDIPDEKKTIELNPEVERYLREFLEYCNDNAPCKVVFTAFPHRHGGDISENFLYKANRVEEIVKEYGYDFINFDRDNEQLGLDIENDYYNNFHMSIYGAQKFTKKFCDILTEEYGVTPSELSADLKAEWEQSAEYTENYIALAESYMKEGRDEFISEDSDLIDILVSGR